MVPKNRTSMETPHPLARSRPSPRNCLSPRRRHWLEHFHTNHRLLPSLAAYSHTIFPADCTHFPATTASNDLPLPPSTESLDLLRKTTTAGSILFNPAFTSRPRPRQAPFPDTNTIVDTEFASHAITKAKMDGKRHLSSFQQLEKLGEGTYATVSAPPPPFALGNEFGI